MTDTQKAVLTRMNNGEIVKPRSASNPDGIHHFTVSSLGSYIEPYGDGFTITKDGKAALAAG